MSLTDFAFSYLRVLIDISIIWSFIRSLSSFGKLKISEQVDTHQRILPLKICLIEFSWHCFKSVYIILSIFCTILISLFLKQYIWMSSMKIPNKKKATSFNFHCWYKFCYFSGSDEPSCYYKASYFYNPERYSTTWRIDLIAKSPKISIMLEKRSMH
jgi:hypothetical protein